LAAAPSDFSRMVVSPPSLVARRGVVVERTAIAAGVILPPLDPPDQLLADLGGGCTRGQQVLRAIDFGRLGQHAGAALCRQQVAGMAQRRIGRDARPGIGPAALQAPPSAPMPGKARAPPSSAAAASPSPWQCRSRPSSQTGNILDVHGLERRAALQPVGFQQPVDLVHLAAQPDHQHPAWLGWRA
jgi:hypothetical protein